MFVFFFFFQSALIRSWLTASFVIVGKLRGVCKEHTYSSWVVIILSAHRFTALFLRLRSSQRPKSQENMKQSSFKLRTSHPFYSRLVDFHWTYIQLHKILGNKVSSASYCLLASWLNATHFAEARFQMSVAGQTFFSRKDTAHLVSGLQTNSICSNTGKIVIYLRSKTGVCLELGGDHLGNSDSEQGFGLCDG